MTLKKALKKYTVPATKTKFLKTTPIIDDILGGGLPIGKITDLHGSNGAGKTTFSLDCMAAAQAEGKEVVYIDVEHCMDPDYAKYRGVDLDKLIICQPETAEEAIDALDEACSYSAGLVILDSVGGLITEEELEGNKSQAPVARLLAKRLKATVQHATRGQTAVLFINQIRKKIGQTMGSNQDSTGGEALKHFASIRVSMTRVGWIKFQDKVVGFHSKVRAVKNRFYPPYREVSYYVTFDPSSPDVGAIKNYVSLGLVTQKSGGHYEYNGTKFTTPTSGGILQQIKSDLR